MTGVGKIGGAALRVAAYDIEVGGRGGRGLRGL